MKFLPLLFLGAAMMATVLSGCVTQSTTETTAAGPLPDAWPPDLSPEEARGFTPDQCKAILVARAALEAYSKMEIHAHYRVSRQGDDWVVAVQHTLPPGYTMPTGSLSTVVIAPNWSVKRIRGGG